MGSGRTGTGTARGGERGWTGVRAAGGPVRVPRGAGGPGAGPEAGGAAGQAWVRVRGLVWVELRTVKTTEPGR
ncbi:hypothetical protein SCA03_66370 [Streptomyces cacaoi]|uniref:Uncharacterized protein n=1 Tax=Streptomyces cacaoi TaxID=1898 RepID=A0A4Y3R8L5_STRCI|nr:hypothetical protein SCA03_66370 [Streptomyces cacaoi]